MKSAEETRFERAVALPLRRFSKRVGFSMTALLCAFIGGVCGALVGCGPTPDGEPPVVTMACVRSFATTLAEWERFAQERVPEQCRFLDADVPVSVVAEMPPQCGSAPAGEVVGGCYLPGARAIFVLAELDDLARIDVSVHEWEHALSHCVYGDPDQAHARSGLWESSKPDPVETRAQAAAVLGVCL